MLVCVDVGNTGIKAGAFDGATLVATARVPPGATDLPERLGIRPDRIERTIAVSVSESALGRFLAGAGRGALVLGVDLPLRIGNRYERPEKAGRDRLCDAAAAHERAGGAAVAVDLGSAVTVDAVSAEGDFLGGPIAPGRPAFRAGLRAAAPALPELDDREPRPGIPRSTADALAVGAGIGMAGLVDRLVSETLAALRPEGGAEIPVYLTGGDAERVAPWLTVRAEVVPHLTLHGIRVLGERAER